MSATFTSGLRAGYFAPDSRSRNSVSRKWPASTSRKSSMTTPSSSSVREIGGVEPGVMPPSRRGGLGCRRRTGCPCRPVKNRGDDGDVGEMGAAVERIVQRDDVAGLQGVAAVVEDGADTFAHGAEMYRNVRGVGDEVAVGVEDGAGKVQALLDVHTHGRVLQHGSGLFGDATLFAFYSVFIPIKVSHTAVVGFVVLSILTVPEVLSTGHLNVIVSR